MGKKRKAWWIAGAVGIALIFFASRCQSEPMRRVYDYSPSSSRPIFLADPTRRIQRIDVRESGGVTVFDGPTDSTGATSGSTAYENGGTIEFADGSSEHFAKIEWGYDGTGGSWVHTDC